MAMIEIPDELDLALESAAIRAGRSKDEFLQEMIATTTEQESTPLSEFSEAEIAKLRRGVEQLDRGDVVTSDQVDEKFRKFFARLASR